MTLCDDLMWWPHAMTSLHRSVTHPPAWCEVHKHRDGKHAGTMSAWTSWLLICLSLGFDNSKSFWSANVRCMHTAIFIPEADRPPACIIHWTSPDFSGYYWPILHCLAQFAHSLSFSSFVEESSHWQGLPGSLCNGCIQGEQEKAARWLCLRA
jgi:hypothetical protein